MIITRDGKEMWVTKGAYNEIFKSAGWSPKDEIHTLKAEETSGQENTQEDENDANLDNRNGEMPEGDSEPENEGEELSYLMSKPVEEFTEDEMKAFVKAFNIDTEGLKKKSEVRKAIESFIASNKE